MWTYSISLSINQREEEGREVGKEEQGRCGGEGWGRGGRGGGCVVGRLHILVVGSFILLHVRVRVVNKKNWHGNI